MLNAFLSLWHVDLLVWCELALLGILTAGTVLSMVRSFPKKLHIGIGFLSVCATAAIILSQHVLVTGIAGAVVLGCAAFALHQALPDMSAKQKKIFALFVGAASLLWIASALLPTQYAFVCAGIGFIVSLPIFLAKTRVSSFFATIVPVVLFIALLRAKQAVDNLMNDDSAFTERCFWIAGLAMLLVAVVKLYHKKQRLSALQLSGVAQLGLVAFMIGAGPAGIIPGILHLGGQAIAHAGLWIGAQSPELHRRHSIRWMTVALFAALLAVPGSILFVSTMIGVGYALQEHLWFALAVYIALGAIAIRLVRAKLATLHATTEAPEVITSTKHGTLVMGIFVVHVLLSFGIGVYLLTQQGIEFAVVLAESIAILN